MVGADLTPITLGPLVAAGVVVIVPDTWGEANSHLLRLKFLLFSLSTVAVAGDFSSVLCSALIAVGWATTLVGDGDFGTNSNFVTLVGYF